MLSLSVERLERKLWAQTDALRKDINQGDSGQTLTRHINGLMRESTTDGPGYDKYDSQSGQMVRVEEPVSIAEEEVLDFTAVSGPLSGPLPPGTVRPVLYEPSEKQDPEPDDGGGETPTEIAHAAYPECEIVMETEGPHGLIGMASYEKVLVHNPSKVWAFTKRLSSMWRGLGHPTQDEEDTGAYGRGAQDNLHGGSV
ncbi:unnamed protein product [marine sediment metagenome]|uniref:Uncharacterized protein n=1 Tax=marine sediment metagenome TaxID=412755 RepID=X0V7K2_9ZZZZ